MHMCWYIKTILKYQNSYSSYIQQQQKPKIKMQNMMLKIELRTIKLITLTVLNHRWLIIEINVSIGSKP